MPKITYQKVKDYIEFCNYELLSDEYISAHTKLEVKCPVGHIYKVTWNNFKNGRRCPYCCDKRRYSDNDVRELVEKEGYEWLDETHVPKNGITLRCPNDHIFNMKLDRFVLGNRCVQYYHDSMRYTYNYIKEQLEKEGYSLIDKEYFNSEELMEIECPVGHRFKMSWNHFKTGSRCHYCCKRGGISLEYSTIKNEIEKFEHTLLTEEYNNNQDQLTIKCSKGHIFQKMFLNFRNYPYCPICQRSFISSEPERQIREFIDGIGLKYVSNDRTKIINPNTKCKLELDFYFPELNKAIEFNGKYWHSLDEVKIRDNVKSEQCMINNIDLLIVEEQGYMDNKEEQLNKIGRFLTWY